MANIFHFNLQSHKCWLRTHWASVPLGMQGQSEPVLAQGEGSRLGAPLWLENPFS